MKTKEAVPIPDSPHAEAAKVLADKLRALRTEIPRFIPEEPGEARALASKSAVSEEFMEAASASMQASDLLDGSSPTTSAALRDSVAFALALTAVLTEAKAFVRAVAHTIRAAKADAGGRGLDIYAVAQRLAKTKEGADLVPHVQAMRRTLKRGRRRAGAEPATAPPVKPTPV
jgi:hypothetical protein